MLFRFSFYKQVLRQFLMCFDLKNTEVKQPLTVSFKHFHSQLIQIFIFIKNPATMFHCPFFCRPRTRPPFPESPRVRSLTSVWFGARWPGPTATPAASGPSSPRTFPHRPWARGCGSWCTHPESNQQSKLIILSHHLVLCFDIILSSHPAL